MSVEPTSQPPRRSSGLGTVLLWILLILSLAANAFFVGASWRTGSFIAHRVPSGDRMLSPRAFMAELSPATRDKVQAELRAHRAEFAQHFANLVASRKAVLDAMKAEPFDVGAYRKALENSAAVDGKARQQAIDFFVTLVQELTPQERKAVAERLDKRGSKWRRGGWRREGWKGGGPFEGPDQPGPQPPPGPQGPAPAEPQSPPSP